MSEQSPHRRILVLAANHVAFEVWLLENNLSRHNYTYVCREEQIRGSRWENAYLIRGDGWELNPLNGAAILDRNFPGWRDTSGGIPLDNPYLEPEYIQALQQYTPQEIARNFHGTFE